MGEDEDGDQDLMDSEMAQQLKHLNDEEEGDDGEGDDDDQLIDIDNLQDNEKAILDFTAKILQEQLKIELNDKLSTAKTEKEKKLISQVWF